MIVEWKISNIDVASGGKHASGLPMHVSVVVDQYAHLTKVGRQIFGATTVTHHEKILGLPAV